MTAPRKRPDDGASGPSGVASALRRIPRPILVLGLVLLGVVALRVHDVRTAEAASHPEPRDGVTAARVLPAARYADYPLIATVYEQAAEIPAVLDGLYCHCGCSEHSGHRSLLTCFESDHAAGCDICLDEAARAHEMHARGASLRDIRAAIDGMFTS